MHEKSKHMFKVQILKNLARALRTCPLGRDWGRSRTGDAMLANKWGVLAAVVGAMAGMDQAAMGAAFTPGNAVVVRVGSGAAALAASGTAVFLDEYTPSGTLVQSIALPTAASGANRQFAQSGTATSEGFLSLSADGRYLVVGGYDVALLATTPPAATVARVVARIDMAGNVDTTTAFTDSGSGNLRGVCTGDGTAFWGATSSTGLRYALLGGVTSVQLNSTATNLRVAGIFNGQLYASGSASTVFSVVTVGTGLPTSSGQTVTTLSGLPIATGPSAYDFFFANPTTLYLADDRSIASSGGVQKWVLVGSTWTLSYTLTAGISTGVRGLTGYVNSAGNTVLYATTTETSNRLVTLTDSGVASSFTTVALAGTNKVFRGVRILIQPVVDGAADSNAAIFGTALSVQAAPTTFGDETGGSTSCANLGSELDQAYGVIRDGTLYLHIAGNLQTNNNKLCVFIDSIAGGQNALRGDNDSGNTISHLGNNGGGGNWGGGGLTFDAAFSPDYCLELNAGCPTYGLFADFYTLPSAIGGTKTFVGSTTTAAGNGTLSGGTNPNSIRATLDNSNVAGVTASSAASAGSVSKGLELAIPLAAIGNPVGDIKVCALIADSNFDSLSNQVLGPLAASGVSFGHGSFRNFASDADATGNQFFTVSTGCAAPAITVQPPTSISQCSGSTVAIGITATGSGLGYIWQQSTDGSTWTAAVGSNTSAATMVTSTAAVTPLQYRCIVTGTCGSVISGSAALIIPAGSLPSTPTNIAANSAFITPGGSSVLSASVNPNETLDWFAGSCGQIAAGTGPTLTVSPTATTTYFAKARNTTSGCTSAACASVTVAVNAFSPVVISQIYSRANAATPLSTFNRNFVELYNRSSSPVNLATYTLQVTTSGSTASWSSQPLTGSIPGNGYYLIAMTSTPGTNGAAISTPDATFASAVTLSATDGKVALVNGTATLTAACFNPGTGGIVDLVGFDAAAVTNCFEGSGPALANGANTAATLRRNNGSQDTDNNSFDFTTDTPNPRNTASATSSPTLTGACCTQDGSCTITTSTTCAGAASSYGGDNSVCPASFYSVATRTAALDDISTQSPTTVFSTGDETNSSAIALPFAFQYFGLPRTQVFLNCNGWMSISPTTPTTSNTNLNAAFPSTALPNDVLSPYWDDLDLTVGTGGRVYTLTKGTPPNRQFIAQWDHVPFHGGAAGVNNTFQIILWETSNAIEFRYGTIVQDGTTGAGAVTASINAGIENSTGLTGINITPSSLGNGGAAVAKLFLPVGAGCAPATGACCNGSSCTVVSSAVCQTNVPSGAFLGVNVSCTSPSNPCAFGACCNALGGCAVLSPAACTSAGGGFYQGDNTLCGDTPCPALGACCITSSCSIQFQANCNGSWTSGNLDSCSPNPCIGACCQTDGTCAVTTSTLCTGSFSGGGTVCGGTSYSAATPGAMAVEDISADVAATQLALGDDASSDAITLPFTFYFFNNPRTSLVINSNGWLSFDTGSIPTASAMRTPVLPVGAAGNSAAPNDAIFAYWRDLNENTGQTPSQLISWEVKGAAPMRRFIALWKNIAVSSNTGNNTFEIILFEGSNTIELRWGDIDTTGTFGAGLEDAAGASGTDIPQTSISSNTSRLFSPAGLSCAQPTGACCNSTACIEVSYASCQAGGFVFRGVGVTCASSPCVPTGACCDLFGACLVLTQASCNATGGSSYVGDNAPCSPTSPCVTGACCTAVGACNARTSFGCIFQSGYYTIDNTLCSANPCITGACCAASGNCTVVLDSASAALCSSSYQGANSTCGNVTYAPPTTPNLPIEDITSTGTQIVFTSSQDNDATAITLPFAFSFYGIPKTDASVGTNGHMTFSGTAIANVNDETIPTVTTPNDAVYPLWDDLSMGPNGRMLMETRGTFPNRRFIVQWDRVTHSNDLSPFPENTFQVVLFETANAIAFRYGQIASASTLTATVGIENAAGTLAAQIPQSAVSPGNVTKVFIPSGLTCAQPTGACCTTNGCTSVSYAGCISLGGSYQGDGTACATTPGSLLASPATICPDGVSSSTLSAVVGQDETVDWYTGSCGGTPVSGGASPVVIPAATTIYYARARNTSTGCVSDTCASVTVTVSDTTPPTITCPPGVVVQCPGNLPGGASTLAAFLSMGGTYTDNCSSGVPVVSYADGSLVGSSCGGQITRVYSVTDGNGNISTCNQVFTVQDTIPPVISCPAAVSVQCAGDVPAPAANLASFQSLGGTATDNCGSVTVAWVGDGVPAPAGPGANCGVAIARTYRATDACGNTADCTQSITINDTTPPVITSPAPVSVQCIADVPAHAIDAPSFKSAGGFASDNCSSVTVTWISDSTLANPCGGTINRRYRATDSCGNSADCTQVITVHDTTPPVISICASAQTVQGDGMCHGTIPDLTGLITASDNCTPLSGLVISQVPASGAAVGLGITHVIISVADACGNIGTCTTDVNVQDSAPHTIAYVDDDFASLPNGTQVTWPWSGSVGGPLTIGCTAFASIQGAINIASPGAQIHVAAGTYLENLVIAKPITLSGANAGICAADGSARGAETVLRPAATSSAVDGILLYITASDVTIDGFTLDGDNLLPGGEAVNSGFADVSNIISNGSFYNPSIPFVNIRNLHAVNNFIRHSNDVAVNLYADGVGLISDANDIECNTFSEHQGTNTLNAGGPFSRLCVLLYNDTYATVDHNLFDAFSVGVQAGNNSRAMVAGGASISSNTFTHFDNLAIWLNRHYANASDWAISANSVDADPAVIVAEAWGIYISSILAGVNVVCADNNVSHCDTGIRYWNTPTMAGLILSGGTLQSNHTGFVLTNVDPISGAGDPSTVTLRGVHSINNGVHGLTVSDEPLGLAHVQHLIVEGCTATGHPVGGGINVNGLAANLSVRNATNTLTNNAYGIYATKGGRVLVEDADLRGNAFAGIQIGLGTMVDAGDCTGSNFSGLGTGHGPLGSSHGGNTLTGYISDNFSPWALANLNVPNGPTTIAYAHNNDFGATSSTDINSFIFDHADAGAFASVLFSQSGGQGINTQPASQSACPGSNVSFGVVAFGPVTYQWQRNGVNIGGATASSLLLSGIGPADVASYTVVVTDVCGNVSTSNPAALALLPTPSAPSSAGSSDSGYCASAAPATITLSAVGGSGTTFTWYSDSCGGTAIGTGTVLSGVPAPTSTQTYYGRWSTGCGDSACAAVTVIVNPNPNAPIAGSDSAVCVGLSANVSATTAAGETVDWFTGSCGGTPAGTGNSISVSPLATTTYYGRARNTTTGCLSATCAQVTVTVNPLPATPSAGSSTVICNGAPISLTGSAGAGETLDWYSGSCGGAPVGSGLSVSVSPASTTTYFARSRNTTTGCVSANCASVVVTVNALPPPPTVSAGSTICPGGSFLLSGSVIAGETIDWYSDSCGGTLAGSGLTLSVSPTATTTYYARSRVIAGACVSTTCATVTVTVSDTTPPTINCPPSVSVSWSDAKDPYATGVATATDSCDAAPVVTYSDDRSGLTSCSDIGGRGIIVRTWTATDASGNSISCQQTITVTDTTAPVLSACPADQHLVADGACSAVGVFIAPTAYDQQHFQGFEPANFQAGGPEITSPFNGSQSTDWNSANSTVQRVLSGTDGVPSKTGVAHARIDSSALPSSPDNHTGAYTRLGGDGGAFACGFGVSQDIYINLADPAVVANTYGWDLSAAANSQSHTLVRDFVFHAASDALGNVLIGGSNTPGITRRVDLASINHYTIAATGWYTFEWNFRDSGSGVLAVDLNLRDASGGLLWTETRSDPSDLISTIVGGNRSMRFTFLEVAQLHIDNTSVRRPLPVVCSFPSGTAFPTGTTHVTCSASDACGNVGSCGFDVYVEDTTPPTITSCGADSSAFAGAGCTAPVPDYTGSVVASDNCTPSGSLLITQVPAAGTSVGLGPTLVTITVADLAHNIDTCVRTFTVLTNLAAPISASVNVAPYCVGTQLGITLSALGGSGTTLRWYDDFCGGHSVGTGSPLSIPAPGASTSYFARWESDCGATDCVSVPVTVYPIPGAPAIGLDSTICIGDSTTVAATPGVGEVVDWFAGSCGGTPAGTGNALAVSPTATTTYYARARNTSTGCIGSVCSQVTVTVIQLPTVNSGGPYSICANGVASLLGSATNAASVSWSTSGDGAFSNASILNPVYIPGPADATAGSAMLLLTANPTLPCSGPVTSSASLTINPIAVPPTSASVDANNFCAGSVANITLTAFGGSGFKLHWTANTCVGASLGMGTSLTIPAPAATTTYYARWVNGCGTTDCVSVTVIVNPTPILPTVGSNGSICTGQPFTLTGSAGAGEVIDWYEGSCGGTTIGTGFSLVVTPAATTTYFARARNTSSGCVSSGCKPLIVTVSPMPISPTEATVDVPAYCSGSVPANITLTASGGSGGTYVWYSGSCGGTPIGTGSPLTIAAPSSSTNYFVRRESGDCTSSACASVSVTVNPAPTSATGASVDATDYCTSAAPTTITLSATGGTGGTYHWYSTSCGTGPIGTGPSITIAAPTLTTIYSVRRETATCNSPSCASVTVTVSSTPVAPTGASVDSNSFCEGAVPTITLSAAGGSGTTLKWYSGACGGVLVGAGSPLTIASPIVSTTYFARWETPLCGNSACANVDVHVDPSAHAPTGINTSADSFCAGSVSTLTLTAVAGSGDTLEWFEGSCAGTPIGTGNPLVIPAPSSSTTYFARWTIALCGPSTCATIAITVNPVTGACCTGWGTQKGCTIVDPVNCIGVTTPTLAYRGNCTACGTPFCCGADYNNNGSLEIQDIFDFLAAWFQQVFTSDFNHDGAKNVQDIFDFLAAWFAGCH